MDGGHTEHNTKVKVGEKFNCINQGGAEHNRTCSHKKELPIDCKNLGHDEHNTTSGHTEHNNSNRIFEIVKIGVKTVKLNTILHISLTLLLNRVVQYT